MITAHKFFYYYPFVPLSQVSSLRSQLARPARPGATGKEGPQSFNIPVWARGATEVGQCLRKKNPVWAREYWNIGMVEYWV